MLKVVVTSANPVKIQGVRLALGRIFLDEELVIISCIVDSEVPGQPTSRLETRQGAINRVRNAFDVDRSADYYFGLEGGIEDQGDEMYSFSYVAVMDNSQKLGVAQSTMYTLPPKVVELIRQGKELGEADDIVYGQTNSKQKQGSIGTLTHGLIERGKMFEDTVIMAMIPFMNPTLYC